MNDIPRSITITTSEDNNGDDDNNINNPLLNSIFYGLPYDAIAMEGHTLACRTALYAKDYIISDKCPIELAFSIFTNYSLFYNRYRVLSEIKQIQIPNIQIISNFGLNNTAITTDNTANVTELPVDSAQHQDELARKIDRSINHANEFELELLDKINTVDNNEMIEKCRMSLGEVKKTRASLEEQRRKLDSIRNNKKEAGDNNDQPTTAVSLADEERRRANLLAKHSNRRKKTTAASSSDKDSNSNKESASTTTELAEEGEQQLQNERGKEQRESGTTLDNGQSTTLSLTNTELASKEQQAVSPTEAATEVDQVAAFQSNVTSAPSIPALDGSEDEQEGVNTVSAAQEVITSVIVNVQANESNTEEVVHSVDESPTCTDPVLQGFREDLMNLDGNKLNDFKEDFSYFIEERNRINNEWNKRKEASLSLGRKKTPEKSPEGDTTSAASSLSNIEDLIHVDGTTTDTDSSPPETSMGQQVGEDDSTTKAGTIPIGDIVCQEGSNSSDTILGSNCDNGLVQTTVEASNVSVEKSSGEACPTTTSSYRSGALDESILNESMYLPSKSSLLFDTLPLNVHNLNIHLSIFA